MSFPRIYPLLLNTVAGLLGLRSAWTGHEKKPMTGCAAKDHTGA